MINGKVVKGVGGLFDVMTSDGVITCIARKKIRHNENNILIGDKVTITKQGKHGTIEEVIPRYNRMLRPVVANVDQVFIVTAPMPPADYMLIDKILINCVMQKIDVTILVNKCEIAAQQFFDKININYKGLVDDIVNVSSHKDIGIDKVKELLKGKTTCFTGQSGVGKTSLLNAILPEYKGEIGAISARISRGKNTTRHTQLFSVDADSFVVDTPGFSLLELTEIKPSELMLYYGDFNEYLPKCKYKMCTHTNEPSCAVKDAVSQGLICKGRYERYLDLHKELTTNEQKRYDI